MITPTKELTMNRTYQVAIKTGDREKAGTDAEVFIQLFGANGSTPEIKLDHPNFNDFEKGHVDVFEITGKDVGWINKVRLFHNNKKDQPGWYVDTATIRYKDIGLEVESDFYRWLATTTGDGLIDVTHDINVGSTNLTKGILQRSYIGYQTKRRKNESQTTDHYTDKFAYEYSEGLGISLSRSISTSTNLQLSASFFGIGSSFEITVTTQASRTLSCSTQQSFHTEIDLSTDIPPSISKTYVALFYQDMVIGKLLSCGIETPFEQRFSIGYDLISFDGWLSDTEIESRVVNILATSLGMSVPAHRPNERVDFPFKKRELVGNLTARSISEARRGEREGVLRAEHLHPYIDASLIKSTGRRVTKVT
jgi:hypothetical protein